MARSRALVHRRGCRTELDVESLARGYEVHADAVEAFFASTPSRASRFLNIDFTLPDSGRTLCNFVTSDAAACSNYTTIPNVAPEELDDEWLEEHGHMRVQKEINARLLAVPDTGGFTCSERHECPPRLTK
jgi:hypothetical protein